MNISENVFKLLSQTISATFAVVDIFSYSEIIILGQ